MWYLEVVELPSGFIFVPISLCLNSRIISVHVSCWLQVLAVFSPRALSMVQVSYLLFLVIVESSIMLMESDDGAIADLASRVYIAASGGNCLILSALTTHLHMFCYAENSICRNTKKCLSEAQATQSLLTRAFCIQTCTSRSYNNLHEDFCTHRFDQYMFGTLILDMSVQEESKKKEILSTSLCT